MCLPWAWCCFRIGLKNRYSLFKPFSGPHSCVLGDLERGQVFSSLGFSQNLSFDVHGQTHLCHMLTMMPSWHLQVHPVIAKKVLFPVSTPVICFARTGDNSPVGKEESRRLGGICTFWCILKVRQQNGDHLLPSKNPDCCLQICETVVNDVECEVDLGHFTTQPTHHLSSCEYFARAQEPCLDQDDGPNWDRECSYFAPLKFGRRSSLQSTTLPPMASM